MGRHNRGKNKRNVDNTAGAEKLYRPRLGNSSSSGTPAGSGDDPESYTKPSSSSSSRRRTRKRGFGKLRGRNQDDATTKTEVEVSPESSTKNSGETTSPSTTLDAQAGVSGAPLEQDTNSPVRQVVGRQEGLEQQVQEGTTPGDEKDEGASASEKEPAAAVVTAKESDCTGGGSSVGDDGAFGHPPVSCISPATTTTPSGGRGLVPTLPLGSTHVDLDRDEKEGRVRGTVAQADRKPYSLAWAGGRKGRPLMRSVEDVLSDWLCTQEAKGIRVGEEVAAIRALSTSNYAPLGQLAERLCMPEAVACALGLRLRERDWEELLGKIAAARDFLDLKAEAACSSALAAFGSQASAPRRTDQIPIDAFAALAREEAAGLDLAELELRQALRAHANQVAPRLCTSAASCLFLQGLDPDATGAVAASDLASFAFGLLGLPTEVRFQAAARWSSEAPHGVTTGTPRGTAAVSGSGGRRPSRRGSASLVGAAGPRSTASPGSSSASNRNRARRSYGVIERLAKTAAAAAGSYSRTGTRKFQGSSNSSHPRQAWAQLDSPGRGSGAASQSAEPVATTVNGPFFGANGASAVRREHGARRAVITHSTFCRFVEGKKFDCKASIEGFLRTLSGAGRLLAAHGAAADGEGASSQGQAAFSATTATRRISSSSSSSSPGEGGSSPRTVGTARWGARGLRRASSQFAHDVSPTKRSTVDSSTTTAAHSLRETSTTAAQAHIGVTRSSLSKTTAARGVGGGGSSARSSGVTGYPSSRSGTSATPRSAANSSGGFLNTPRGGISGPRGSSGFVAEALLSLDVSGSGTVSSVDFISAANRVTGLPVRQEWGEVLARRFAAGTIPHGVENKGGASCTGIGGGSGGGGGGGGVRWLGGSEDGDKSSRLDVAALVDFIRPKSFSLSVMTPFGLVELLLEDPCLTLGGLREIMVNNMFWRQHNCQVRRSDRDNFTLSRYYGNLPLDTESPGQRRRLVLDVLRPGELIFVTDRVPRRSRQEEPRSVPKFQYMMGGRNQHAGEDTWTRFADAGSTQRRKSSAAASATAVNAASKPPRRSSAPPSSPFSPRRRQLVGATTFAAAAAAATGSTKTSPGRSRFSSRGERRLKDATSCRRSSQPAGRTKGCLKAGAAEATPDGVGALFSAGKTRVVQAVRDGEGELLSTGAGEREHGREESRWGGSRPGSPWTKESRSAPDFSSVVFDWSVDQVERWIGETLELECCRDVFRANKIDGLRLGGLTQDHLMKDLGIKNAFHARKVDLHLNRLLEDALGPHAHVQIPERVATWRNREFLMWCWQDVGVRHRPTLALLHQAGIDGVVLLALEPVNWAHLVVTSPNASCTAPLESIRRASLELLSPHRPGNPLPLPGGSASPERNDADRPSTKLQGENVHTTNGANDVTAKETPDDRQTIAVHDGPEDGGASKADERAAGVVVGGRNSHDDSSLSLLAA